MAKRHTGTSNFITIPNVWSGQITPEEWRLFKRTKGKEFVRQLSKELEDPYLQRVMRSDDHVFAALASRWIGQIPPSLFSYLSFRSDVGNPRSIDLDSIDIPVGVGSKRPSVERDRSEEAITRAVSMIRRLRSSHENTDVKGILRRVQAEMRLDASDDGWRAFQALLLQRRFDVASARFPERSRKARRRRPPSIDRMSRAIPKVSSKINSDDVRILLTKVESTVLTLFIEVMDETELTNEEIARFKVPSYTPRRKVDLRAPSVYQRYYGLDLPAPIPEKDIALAARRVLTNNLHYGGQRAACVALMTLGDITDGGILDGIEHANVFCRFSKTRSAWNSWFPICYLWPDDELKFLQIFVQTCLKLGFQKSMQVMQIARLGHRTVENDNGPYDKNTVDFAQFRLRDGIIAGRRLATHWGRYGFASFWGLRLLAARWPGFNNALIGSKIKGHFWFREEGLTKLRLILQNGYNPLLAASQLMGLSGPEQLIGTYNRGQPLELSAYNEYLSGQEAAFFT